MPKIKISLLAMHEDLSIRCLDLIKELGLPVTLENPRNYHLAAQYNRFIDTGADIVIGLDEDCFITDKAALLDIANYMIDNAIPFMAMRELSGVSKHRLTMKTAKQCDYNSFLMFTQPKLIIPKIDTLGNILGNYQCSEWIELYWKIFRHLADVDVKGLDLQGYDHADNISTILTWNTRSFAVHTWYAREWETRKIDPGAINHRQRIKDRYSEIGGYKWPSE